MDRKALIAASTALALAAGILLAPRWLRTRRRERRLAGTGDPRLDTLSAWEEVQDAASDHGLTWPDGSPRYAAERFVTSLGADGAAAESLRRLAAASERALYDAQERYDLQGSWREEVTQVHTALAEEARRRKKATPRRGGRRGWGRTPQRSSSRPQRSLAAALRWGRWRASEAPAST